jgi:hypothetical protein
MPWSHLRLLQSPVFLALGYQMELSVHQRAATNTLGEGRDPLSFLEAGSASELHSTERME